jgi:hypothetical protein
MKKGSFHPVEKYFFCLFVAVFLGVEFGGEIGGMSSFELGKIVK